MLINCRTVFHSETGTEGGFWAVQDEAWIKPNTTRFYCTKCHLYWDKSRDVDEPVRVGEYCQPGQHDFKLVSPEDWSYEGLHVLHDGDELTVYGDHDEVLWEGTIRLVQYDQFTQHAGGWWIHADQEGVDRIEWARLFMTEHRAVLRTVQ